VVVVPTIDLSRGLVAFHAPKSGSSHVMREMQADGAFRLGEQHEGVDLHRWALKGQWTAFGTVRNPWDWYCSWYQHAMSTRGDGCLPGYGKTFREVLRAATGSPELWPVRPGVFYDFDDDRRWAGGLCTQTHESIYGYDLDAYVSTDRINEGLSRLLGREVTGQKHSADAREGRDVTRPWESARYADWYDDQMVEWVAGADASMINRFGFEPFTMSPRAFYRENP